MIFYSSHQKQFEIESSKKKCLAWLIRKSKIEFIKCYSSSYWGKFRRIKLVACRCGADDRETQDWTCSQFTRKHGRWKQQSRNFNGSFKRHWIWDNEECHSTDTDKVERLEFIFKEKPWSEDKTEDYKSKIHNLFELISVLFFLPETSTLINLQ